MDMVTRELLVFYVSFHTNYYNFITIVTVFYIIKDSASQEEKNWLLTNILQVWLLFRIIPYVSSVLLVTRWPLT